MNWPVFIAVTLCFASWLAAWSYIETAEWRGEALPSLFDGGTSSTGSNVTLFVALLALTVGLAHLSWWAVALAITAGLRALGIDYGESASKSAHEVGKWLVLEEEPEQPPVRGTL